MTKKSDRGWRIYPIVFKQSKIDAMALADFSPLDEEEREFLRSSKMELHRRMASDDPEIVLQAFKDSLARLVVVEDE